jgi:imidazolonepropionase-like amidohydrolase
MAVTVNLAQLARIPPTLVAAQARPILEGMLARGFTAARDAGGAEWGLAEAVRLGFFKGPRLFISGLALAQTGGQGDFRQKEEIVIGCPCCNSLRSISRVVDGVDAIRAAAREELRKGATQIKIMAGGGIASGVPVHRAHFSREELTAVVDEAERAGTYVMAHAYSPLSIRRCVEAGVRTIEHGNLIDAEAAALMAERGAYVVPTLAVYEGYRKHGDEYGLSDKVKKGLEDLLEAGLRSFEIYRTAGVKIGLGSDLEGNLHSYHLRELALRAQVASPAEVIASATVVNAEILQMQGRLGVVAPGAFADLLVVDGDPLRDLGLLQEEGRHLSAIMQNGVFYKNRLSAAA